MKTSKECGGRSTSRADRRASKKFGWRTRARRRRDQRRVYGLALFPHVHREYRPNTSKKLFRGQFDSVISSSIVTICTILNEMSKARTLLERISPATPVANGQVDIVVQGPRAHNEGGPALQSSEPGASTQPLAASSIQPTGSKKRKRRAADVGDAEREIIGKQEEPEKLLAPWFSVATESDLTPLNTSYLNRCAAQSIPQRHTQSLISLVFIQRLHAEVLALTSYLSPTPQEKRARALLISYITALVHERWPARYGRDNGVTVHTFGSVATGLELPGGDIDLVLDFPSNVELSAKDCKSRLFQLAAVLRSPERAGVVRVVNVVARARVPIVTILTVDELGT